VAKKLMQRVVKEATERDVHNIVVYVRNDNKVSSSNFFKMYVVKLLFDCCRLPFT
jgi:L-amino acid N-acyltransferase YncA